MLHFNLQEGSSTTDFAINHSIVLIDVGRKNGKAFHCPFLGFRAYFLCFVEIDLKRVWGAPGCEFMSGWNEVGDGEGLWAKMHSIVMICTFHKQVHYLYFEL